MEQKLLYEILTGYVQKLQTENLEIKSLLLGPKEYLVLKSELNSVTIADEFGSKELMTFMGYPIRVKVTQGIEPEIDVNQISRYIKTDAVEVKNTSELLNRAEIRDVGTPEITGNP